MKIALISCAKEKKLGNFKAKDLYDSPLFFYNYKYANKVADKVFILSAKWGLLDPEKEISYYNETLNEKTKDQIKVWSMKVLIELEKILKAGDQIIFLAGQNYRMFIEPYLKNKGYTVEVPMEHLGIGKQLAELKRLT